MSWIVFTQETYKDPPGNQDHHTSARDFLNELIALPEQVNIEDKDRLQVRFIFRGVPDDTFRLVPSALRTRCENDKAYDGFWSIADCFTPRIAPERRDVWYNQRKAELFVARAFYTAANRGGLTLPPLSDAVRDELLTGPRGDFGVGHQLELATIGRSLDAQGKRVNGAQWPPPQLLPILGLAQHYELPTRLLDWSASPLIAAYFAGSKALTRLKKKADPNSSLCVWATLANSFPTFAQIEARPDQRAVHVFPVRLVHPPPAGNPNLFLQHGVFTVAFDPKAETLESEAGRLEPSPDRREVHKIAFEATDVARMKEIGYPPPMFFKLRLCIGEAPKLLMLLRDMGISASRVYDGFAGSARDAREQAMISEYIS